jgi:hypothetical protein
LGYVDYLNMYVGIAKVRVRPEGLKFTPRGQSLSIGSKVHP